MKGLILIFAVILFSCHESKPFPVFHDYEDSVVKLSVNNSDSSIRILIDTSNKVECQAERREIDSLKTELFLYKFRVEKVQYYLNICLKKPSQDRFLKGWIKRAIE